MEKKKLNAETGMDYNKVHTYDEAVQAIEEIGILPLANLVPGHPSLESLTEKDHWYTGSDLDPWLWRARFPGDGTAAYGKFFKKKSILISRECFPWVKLILGSPRPLEERYEDGLVSKPAMELFQHIQAEPGIETRQLRAEAGMKAPEMKKIFDQALLELQGSLDIVISGVQERRNSQGERNGWNSTSYETVDDWIHNARITVPSIDAADARHRLKERLQSSCSPEAMIYFGKLFSF